MTFPELQKQIVKKTESLLTRYKRHRLRKNHRLKQRHPALEWGFSILFIIVLVILINMFVFQNYRIPSESMVPALQVGDLIFVEKVVAGPEILPGVLKLPGLRDPLRGEVVSFESRLYAREGWFSEFVYRFVYFITLSAVNLKTDPASNEAVKDLLIKRVIGLRGETVRIKDGQFQIRRETETGWMPEDDINASRRNPYYIIWDNQGPGKYFFEQDPFRFFESSAQRWLRSDTGWYIPDGMFFPMGDNRVNSTDARIYGPVPVSRIQGRAIFRFFPFGRIGLLVSE